MQQYLCAIREYRASLYQYMSFGDCMLELRAALVYILKGGVALSDSFPIDPLHAAAYEGKSALRKSTDNSQTAV